MVSMGQGGNREEIPRAGLDGSLGSLSSGCSEAPKAPVTLDMKVLASLRPPSEEGAGVDSMSPEMKLLIVPFLRLLETKGAQEQPVLLKQGELDRMFVDKVPEMYERKTAVMQDLSIMQRFLVTVISGIYTPRALANFYQDATDLMRQLLRVLEEDGLIRTVGFTGLMADCTHGIGPIFVPYRETGIQLTEKGQDLLRRQTLCADAQS